MSRIDLERTAQEMSWGSRMRARDNWSRVVHTISGMDRHALAAEINKAEYVPAEAAAKEKARERGDETKERSERAQ